MHAKDTVILGCTDCHGGNAQAYKKRLAHVLPRYTNAWKSAANPVRSYTLLNHESPSFIQFVNPGDLRVAHMSCGQCHSREVLQVRKSMMTHGAMLWGAALYNNGSFPLKWPRYGEAYSMNGTPLRLQTVPPPTQYEIEYKGVVPYLDPLPRFEMTHPGNLLRFFERGGRFRPEVGIPDPLEEAGRPRRRLSVRGLGTENRTDPVYIGLQKTRLLDPTLNFLGTNDHAGDYRSSGCTSCHVIYANDRSPVNSGPYARFGNRGTASSTDPTIPKNESGHPIEHKFTLSIPTSQCIVCHVHPGTSVLNSYTGFMWWDNETDGELMYPLRQKYLSSEEIVQAASSNPEEGSVKGFWSNPEFLQNVSELNRQTRHTQFADFTGHGWVFRAVYQKDRKGILQSHTGKKIEHVTNEQLASAIKYPEKVKAIHKRYGATELATLTEALLRLKMEHSDIPVHMLDIHLEKGMHCIDCHFNQDNHGNTKLYGEVRAAIEIQCIDCHGTVSASASLLTTGPAAPDFRDTGRSLGSNLKTLRTPFGKRRFEKRGDLIVQNSMVEEGLSWVVKQTRDTMTPGHPSYNKSSHLAKTIRIDSSTEQMSWGGTSAELAQLSASEKLAHCDQNMSCIACHSSWNPSCFGCHLVQKANVKSPILHWNGDVTRNYTSYNFQTLRDDVYMLAKDGNVTGNRIGPARSACAIMVGSYNDNRESIYVQQQTISSEGASGIAFSTNVPHTVRGAGATKMCTDCHVASKNNNNALMAQLLMQGTNFLNFIGRYCWIGAGEHGLIAAVVTERDEPQAVIGSTLHELAFPDHFEKHLEHEEKLEHAHEHPGKDISDNVLRPFKKPEVLSIQHRGEFLYAACGEAGLRVFDIAFIDNKGFAERILTAGVSPVGQKLYVRTKHATSVVAPTTISPDPTRIQRPINHEEPIHPMYAYIYVTDKYEGLILVNVGVLLDGNPLNNFIKRDVTFNPNGILRGATSVTIAGTYAYVCCDAGLVVVSIEDPANPYVTSILGEEFVSRVKSVQIQFRYAYLLDEHGISVLNVTNLAQPIPVSRLPLEDGHNLYLARTYAYVAAGRQGLIILDIEKPENPFIDQVYDADGCMNDVHDVKLGITYNSEFAYVADGKNGLRVVQLTSPETPGANGFSPRPTPKLIATYEIPRGGHALTISEGVDRDRATDESGNTLSVFGRVGARPLNLQEQQKLYLRNRQVWTVSDDPNDYGPPLPSVNSAADRLLRKTPAETLYRIPQ